jgi:hypothetical protein
MEGQIVDNGAPGSSHFFITMSTTVLVDLSLLTYSPPPSSPGVFLSQ